MDIIISNASQQPIYEQIMEQIKSKVMHGELKEDTALPSVRVLAKDLRISVITTKRAYDELEQEGFIYTVAGKGCFVAEKNIQLIRENHLKQIEIKMMEILELGKVCDLTCEQLAEMLILLEEEQRDEL